MGPPGQSNHMIRVVIPLNPALIRREAIMLAGLIPDLDTNGIYPMTLEDNQQVFWPRTIIKTGTGRFQLR